MVIWVLSSSLLTHRPSALSGNEDSEKSPFMLFVRNAIISDEILMSLKSLETISKCKYYDHTMKRKDQSKYYHASVITFIFILVNIYQIFFSITLLKLKAKVCQRILVSLIRRSFNLNRLKCPKLFNKVEVGNENSQNK